MVFPTKFNYFYIMYNMFITCMCYKMHVIRNQESGNWNWIMYVFIIGNQGRIQEFWLEGEFFFS